MLKDINCNLETILIGFLHDIIENTEYSYEYIATNFGKNIADGVLKVSKNMEIANWKDRKVEFMERLKTCEKNIILVELADKFQNLLSDYFLFEKKGKEGLVTLNGTYESNKWFYLEMQKIFKTKISSNALLKRYNELIKIYFSDNDI